MILQKALFQESIFHILAETPYLQHMYLYFISTKTQLIHIKPLYTWNLSIIIARSFLGIK